MTPAAPYRKRWSALVVISLSVVVITMDNTVLNVALPTIARELRATASELLLPRRPNRSWALSPRPMRASARFLPAKAQQPVESAAEVEVDGALAA